MSTWVVVIATGTGTDSPSWQSEVVEAPTRDAAMVRAGAQITALTRPILSVTVRRVPAPRHSCTDNQAPRVPRAQRNASRTPIVMTAKPKPVAVITPANPWI